MTESTLKEYFEDKISVRTLATDLKGSQLKTGHDTISVSVDQIKNGKQFQITRNHLLKLCNDTLDEKLDPVDLNTVAYALIFSDLFIWDNQDPNDQEVIETVVYDWDNPEINFPLTKRNLKLWREYLETGEYKLRLERTEKK